MARLATAYSHFKPFDPTLREQRELEALARQIAERHARETFKTPIEISVHCEEGSWRTWVTIAGAIYGVIAGYGSFRDGIEYIVKDARAFSELVNSELVRDGHVPPSSVFRTERRTETPGRILRTVREAERGPLLVVTSRARLLDSSGKEEPPSHSDRTAVQAERQRRRIVNILRDLDAHERDLFFKSLKRVPSNVEEWLREEADEAAPLQSRVLDTDREGSPRLIVGPDGKSRRIPKPPRHRP